MPSRVILTLSALCVLAPLDASAQSPAERGRSIALKADRANAGYGGEEAELEMVLINAQGDRVKRKISLMTTEMEGDGDRSLLTFEWPADVQGTRLLTWSHARKNDDQWLYLPSLRRVKRISSRNQSGAFMGSEFAFEDLGSQEPEKFTWSFVTEETFEDRAVWRLERVPTSRRSGYSKQIVWMDKQYQQPLRIDYFDRKGVLLKTMRSRKFERHEKWWRPAVLEMINHQTHKKSILRWTDRTMGEDFDPEDFEKEALED